MLSHFRCIHNNVIHSRAKEGITLPASVFPTVKNAWQVTHNSYRDKPSEPPERANGLILWLPGPTDHIRATQFISDDRGEPTKYLRIASDGPLANAGVGLDLPKYIGAFPPGPAPKDGDWFTRLHGSSAGKK